jgi:multimeric flavodoxin WrbA
LNNGRLNKLEVIKEKVMKVLIINGSPHIHGTTARAIEELKKAFNSLDVLVEVINIGNKDIRGCIACGNCFKENGKCIFDDAVNEVSEKLKEADGLILASPVYYASPNATLIAFCDRLFHSSRFSKLMKVGASVCVARRGGITSSFDVLNKYFTISGMPIASGQYWNGVHGSSYEEAEEDVEGLQQMRTLATNMTFLMKSIKLGKETFGLPNREKTKYTNFIR